jgi:hypothetical protein
MAPIAPRATAARALTCTPGHPPAAASSKPSHLDLFAAALVGRARRRSISNEKMVVACPVWSPVAIPLLRGQIPSPRPGLTDRVIVAIHFELRSQSIFS